MNFQSRHTEDPLEINLIPLIDVLLVILVFLAASTSFTQQRQLQLDLPQAQAQTIEINKNDISLAINKDGIYAINNEVINVNSEQELAQAISNTKTDANSALRIEADAQTAHGAVVLALEAAKLSGIERVYFLTVSKP